MSRQADFIDAACTVVTAYSNVCRLMRLQQEKLQHQKYAERELYIPLQSEPEVV